jgi:hypothetical protein
MTVVFDAGQNSADNFAILTHSPELHQSQAAGFDGTTLAKAGKKLGELAATLARGKTRRTRDKIEAEIATITRKPWVRRTVTWQLSGEKPRDLRLAWGIDTAARAALEEELFGKHILITDHDDWPAAGIGETALLYQGERGRPRAHRMLTETTPLQDKLSEIFGLTRYAPRR